MKISIAIDWLDKYAGSERVISSMSKVFQFSEAYTLASVMSKPDLEKTFNGQSPILHKSLLNHAGSHFRALFPFFSFFMRKNKVIPDNDILISSSHAAAKAIKT
jgi:hypothetical protein